MYLTLKLPLYHGITHLEHNLLELKVEDSTVGLEMAAMQKSHPNCSLFGKNYWKGYSVFVLLFVSFVTISPHTNLCSLHQMSICITF